MLFGASNPLFAQQFDLLLKGGHVIDPKNGIDEIMDVAVTDGKIARVAGSVPQHLSLSASLPSGQVGCVPWLGSSHRAQHAVEVPQGRDAPGALPAHR